MLLLPEASLFLTLFFDSFSLALFSFCCLASLDVVGCDLLPGGSGSGLRNDDQTKSADERCKARTRWVRCRSTSALTSHVNQHILAAQHATTALRSSLAKVPYILPHDASVPELALSPCSAGRVAEEEMAKDGFCCCCWLPESDKRG